MMNNNRRQGQREGKGNKELIISKIMNTFRKTQIKSQNIILEKGLRKVNRISTLTSKISPNQNRDVVDKDNNQTIMMEGMNC